MARVSSWSAAWRLGAWMVGLGVVFGWASVFAIPTAQALGVPGPFATRIPYLGFSLGLALGYGIDVSPSIRRAAVSVGGVLLLAAVAWMFALFAGGVLVAIGVSEEFADWLPSVAFLAVLVAGLVVMAFVGLQRSCSAWTSTRTSRRPSG